MDAAPLNSQDDPMPRNAWKELPPGPPRMFFSAINELWISQGAPSSRTIAKALEKTQDAVSHGTIDNLIDGPNLPRWSTVSVVIGNLGCSNPDAYLNLWRVAFKHAHRKKTFLSDIDWIPGGVDSELRSLLRSRGYEDHKTLLIREPSKTPGAEFDWFTIAEVLELVDQGIEELYNADRRFAARILFGIEPQWRESSLSERRQAVAKALDRAPRTIQRWQETLIDDVGAIVTQIMRNSGKGID